jgi:hypothetical protein
MRGFNRRIVPTSIAILAALALGFGAGAAGAASREDRVNLSQAANKRTLLLFPVDVSATGLPNAAEVSDLATDVAASRLIISQQYSVIRYHPALPPVASAHLDQKLTDADLKPPFEEDSRKVLKIARLVGYQVAFVAVVDSYKYDSSSNQATVSMSGRLVDVESGNPIRNVATVSGSSAQGGTAKESERALEATRSAAEQMMAQLAPLPTTPPPAISPEKPKPTKAATKRRGGNEWIWGLIAIGIGLGIGLSGRGGGGGLDTPPPPPR